MTVASISQPHLLSMSAIALAWRTTRDVVRARLVAEGVQPAGQRGGHPVFNLVDVVPVMSGNREDPDTMDPFRRKAYFQAEIERMKALSEAGQLIPRAEVIRDYSLAFQLAAQTLELIPDVLERDTGATQAQLQLVEHHIDRLREELYRRLTSADEPLKQEKRSD